jgi:hypothetical protein
MSIINETCHAYKATPAGVAKFRCRPPSDARKPNKIPLPADSAKLRQPIDFPLFSGRDGRFLDAKPGFSLS